MSSTGRGRHKQAGISDLSGNYHTFPGSVIDLFEKQVDATPDATALEWNGSTWSYRELNSKADDLSRNIIAEGLLTGSVIGVCLEKGLDFYLSVLAILKTGSAYLPFDPAYPAGRISYMEQQAKVQIVITTDEYRDLFRAEKIIIVDEMDQPANDLTDVERENGSAGGDDLVYVLFTSGSTGKPKGVAMPNTPLTNLLQWQKNDTDLGIPARTIQFSALSFDVSFQEMFSCWTTGGTLLPVDDDTRMNAEALAGFLKEKHVERVFLPYVALQQLAVYITKAEVDLPELKDVITAGEQLKVTREIRSFFKRNDQCRLHNHYGPTESHVVTSMTLEGDPGEWDELPPIGTPINNSRIYILNDDMDPVAEKEIGELWIAGSPLSKGYINDQELTDAKFLKDPFNEGQLMYRTGDLAYFDRDGYIHYSGRTDSQVKVRGYRVELAEVELAIQMSNEISDCAVIVHKDTAGIDGLIAYVVTNDEDSVKTIRRRLTGELPEYMVPSRFIKIDKMPRTSSGKIDRSALPAPDRKRPVMSIPFAAPATDLEKSMTLLWKDVLELDRVGVNDNFFELGGNSLQAIRFITLFNESSRERLSVVDLYRKPTISGLCHIIEGYDDEQEHPAAVSAAKVRNTAKEYDNDVAIIGMSGRFPGASDLDEFWEILKNGKETTRFFSDGELDASVPASLRSDPDYVKARGILDDVSGFDASFFNINPKLAALMDPQHRIFLEVAWNAMEHAGFDPFRINDRVGVFAGCGNNSYYSHNVIPNQEEVSKVGSFQVMTANEKDYIATRVSHFMDLKGPAVSVHTACSTSLVAVIMACESIRNGRCEMAIAGGVSVTSPVNSGHIYQEGAMFSKDGHTRPFDAQASGTVFSDGAGAVVLKSYRRALDDGDNIIGLIKGTGINNDGGDKASFTAPSVDGQSAAVRMALDDAGVDTSAISYIETHGTATPLGDPIEVEGLKLAFGRSNGSNVACGLGSVKSNFGHLTAAAGVAGLIKTLLMMQHKAYVPTVNYKKLNNRISFNDTPFFVTDKFTAWDTGHGPLRAGISSFGVGGTNAHVIVESAPQRSGSGPSRPAALLMVSAKSDRSMDDTFDRIERFVHGPGRKHLADACYTLQTGRTQFMHRKFAVLDDDTDTLSDDQSRSAAYLGTGVVEQLPSGIVFMFPGQGSQYAGMGRTLYRDELIFKEAVEECATLFSEHLDVKFIEILFSEDEEQDPLINQTKYTQPALFTVGYALAKLLMHWGVKPDALIGHSIGEFTAACISGVMSLEDAVLVVSSRGKLMQDLPSGSMLSVRKSEKDLLDMIPDDLSVAAVNGPELCVVSGNDGSIREFESLCSEKNIGTKLLHTSHAFHSVMMEPAMEPFADVIARIDLSPPQIPIMSTSAADWLRVGDATDPAYWVNHIRKPVRFAEGVQKIWIEFPEYLMVELGPRNTASILARQQSVDHKMQKAVSTMSDSADKEWPALLNAIGQLWVSGVMIDWNIYYEFESRTRIGLPGYQFNHDSFWIDPPLSTQSQTTGNISQDIQIPQGNTYVTSKTQVEMNENHKRSVVISDLRCLIEDASGIDLSTAGDSQPFVELGLDSLFLTQIALSISRKYNTKITFRQLNDELSSMELLARHIIQSSPSLDLSAPSYASADSQAVKPGSDIEKLIMQQMQMMQQQLELLRKESGASAPVNVDRESMTSNLSDSENKKAEGSKPFGAIARIEKDPTDDLNDEQKKWLSEFIARYNNKTAASKAYTRDHRAHLADPRVVSGFKPALKEMIYQVVVERSEGNHLWDIDGNEYIDVLNGFGSNFLGYGSEVIRKAINIQIEQGFEIGPQHPLAGEVAKLICEFTGNDRAGFCNTGSEAVLGALRIARTVTGRSLVVCFNGSYHGINDEVIVRGTRNLRSIPAAAGIMPESVQNMLVLDYGTDEALEIIRSRADEIAAVLVEPIQSRRADFKPRDFLTEVRRITSEHDSLLIFDEVITGFRLSPGGAQEYFGVEADVCTYGKVIGGGMPIGVIAGKKRFMDALDGGQWNYGDGSVPESGVTYFAGTFVRHPLALAAAKATLLHLKERGDEFWKKLNGLTSQLVLKVNDHCVDKGIPFRLVSFGSLFKVKWMEEFHYGELLFAMMREKGIHIYDGFPCFITDAFDSSDIGKVAETFINSANELAEIGFIRKGSKLNGNHTGADNLNNPPIEGARLGTLPNGDKGWFVPDPDRPGKYMQVKITG
jgi:amino acid adenylation domain-containing protein